MLFIEKPRVKKHASCPGWENDGN